MQHAMTSLDIAQQRLLNQHIARPTFKRPAEVVAWLRQQGVRGVGQSSWGPTVFAVVADAEHAHHLGNHLRSRHALQPSEVLITSAANQGATWR